MKNKYFLGIISFICVSLVITAIMASNQIGKNEIQYRNYVLAESMIEEGKDLDKALSIIVDLKKENPRSESLYLLESYAYRLQNDMEKSQKSLQKALEVNMRLIDEVNFIITYGEISYLNNDNVKAKEMLTKAVQKGVPQEEQSLVNEILQKIG